MTYVNKGHWLESAWSVWFMWQRYQKLVENAVWGRRLVTKPTPKLKTLSQNRQCCGLPTQNLNCSGCSTSRSEHALTAPEPDRTNRTTLFRAIPFWIVQIKRTLRVTPGHNKKMFWSLSRDTGRCRSVGLISFFVIFFSHLCASVHMHMYMVTEIRN